MEGIYGKGTKILIFEDPYDMLKSNYTFGTVIDFVPGTGTSYFNPLMYRVKDIDGNESICSWENIMLLRDYKIFLESEYKCCEKQIEALTRYRTEVSERMDQFEKGKETFKKIKSVKTSKNHS